MHTCAQVTLLIYPVLQSAFLSTLTLKEFSFLQEPIVLVRTISTAHSTYLRTAAVSTAVVSMGEQ